MPARVFVSVASYCDPLLPFTLRRALATARHPQRLHFGVVDQVLAGTPAFIDPSAPARCSRVRIDAIDAHGPCWARALAMSLYDGEEWFLQLDSHMDFDAGWDETLVAQAVALGAPRQPLVLSSYPNAFAFENGAIVRRPTTAGGVLAHVVKPNTGFAPDHPVLAFEAHPVEQAPALPGFHLGAGCLFAPGGFVEAFPYDPWFYFHGEEQALALRVYTHGWDIFHMPALPVHHLYNDAQSGGPPRPLHWDAAHDGQRAVRWWTLEQRSRQRLSSLIAGEALGVYGLGSMRSLADYAAFSGIDYATRTLSPRAFEPRQAC